MIDGGSNEDSPSIEIENLRFRYGRQGYELDIPRFEVTRGERCVITGASGSGKTTLLHLVAGILRPDRGRLQVEGVGLDGASDAERRRFRISRIGMIFQEFELLEHLTVRENILLPYFIHPALSLDRAVEARVEALATGAGIGSYLARKPRNLSHGERQRVAVCRALVTRPPLLLADEPTGNLDPTTTGEILDEIFGQIGEQHATLLLVTHDHSVLDRFDRVVDVSQLVRGAAA